MLQRVSVFLILAFVSTISFAEAETSNTPVKSTELKEKKTNSVPNKTSPKNKKIAPEKPSGSEPTPSDTRIEREQNTSVTPRDSLNATKDGVYAVPAWLYGLQLAATPAEVFENSIASFDLAYLQEKQRLKSSIVGISTKLGVKTNVAATNFSYGSMLKSQKVFLKLDGNLAKGRTDYETSIITSGSIAKSTYTYTADIPELGAAISLQAAPGLWIGAKNSWARDYVKIESKSDAETQTSTSRLENSTQVLGLEHRSYPLHFGIEYSVQNKNDEFNTRLDVPLRLALSDRIFLGASVGSETEKDFSSSSKSNKTYHLLEAGLQSPANAIVFQYEYDLEKSGSATNVSTTKTKTGTVVFNFGAKTGMRFGIATSYLLETTKDLGAPTATKEGGSLQLRIARAQ
jgi:hypothetical protein